MVKRLGIYVIYDRDGIIDDYIPYFLSAVSPHLAHLVIVCNGKLTDAGRQKLLPFTTDIFVRSNEGYDAGAVKEVLDHLYGWDEVLKYDELLIANDTFYGPLFPLSPCFEEMSKRKVDFWGMTKQGELQYPGRGPNAAPTRLAPHIQSYFMNVKKRLLHSRDFRSFWEQLHISHAIHEIIYRYEVAFTTTFAERGYTWEVYLDVGPMISQDAPDNYNYSVLDSVHLIKKYRSPFIKRKAFAYRTDNDNDLRVMGNERKNELMQLITEETTYDTDLIWDNLLRTTEMSDIVIAQHLYYILPAGDYGAIQQNERKYGAVVMAHLTGICELIESLDYLKRLPPDLDIVVMTSEEEIVNTVRASLPKADVHLIENATHDLEALLSLQMQKTYDYLCFVSDQVPREIDCREREKLSYRYLLWENTLASAGYMERIFELFRENKRLGYLTVPQPYYGRLFAKLDSNKVIATGNAFWCRTSAIRRWLESDRDGESVVTQEIGRIFSRVAQAEGYFSGVIMSDRYAAVRNVDLERIVSRVLERVRSHRTFESYDQFFSEALRFDQDLLHDCARMAKLYIYGAGEYAGDVADTLREHGIAYEGFIVSAGKVKPAAYRSHPVFYLSEIPLFDSSTGVVLGLDRRNRSEVIPLLNVHGTPTIITIDS